VAGPVIAFVYARPPRRIRRAGGLPGAVGRRRVPPDAARRLWPRSAAVGPESVAHGSQHIMIGPEPRLPGLGSIKLGPRSIRLSRQVPPVATVLADAVPEALSIGPETIATGRQTAVARGPARASRYAMTILPITGAFRLTVIAGPPRIGADSGTAACPRVVVGQPSRIASRLRGTRPIIARRLRAAGPAIAVRPSRIDVRGGAVPIAAATASLIPRAQAIREVIAHTPVAITETPWIGCGNLPVPLAESLGTLTVSAGCALPVGRRAMAGPVIRRVGPRPVPAVRVWLPLRAGRVLARGAVPTRCSSAAGLARRRV
jgi:hypothetical protein